MNDEVLKCKCKGKAWVIGTGAVRCAACGYGLSDKMELLFVMKAKEAIPAVNQMIKERKK